jgi:DNA repair protein RadC
MATNNFDLKPVSAPGAHQFDLKPAGALSAGSPGTPSFDLQPVQAPAPVAGMRQESGDKKKLGFVDYLKNLGNPAFGTTPISRFPTPYPPMITDPNFPLTVDVPSRTVSLVPFAGSVAEAVRKQDILSAAERIGAGKGADKDYETLKRFNDELDYYADKEKEFGYKVGELMGQSIPFALEFLMTGGAFSAARQSVLKALEKTLEKGLIKKIAVQGLAGAAGFAAQTAANPQMAARIATANIAHKDVAPKLDAAMKDNPQTAEEWKAVLDKYMEGIDPEYLKGILKAIPESTIEITSERAGGIFRAIGGTQPYKGLQVAIGQGAEAIFDRIPGAQLARGLREAIGNRLAAMGFRGGRGTVMMDKFRQGIGFHGILEEMFEERVADVMHEMAAGAGIVEDLGGESPAMIRLFTGEGGRNEALGEFFNDLAVEAVAFGAHGGSMRAIEAGINRATRDRQGSTKNLVRLLERGLTDQQIDSQSLDNIVLVLSHHSALKNTDDGMRLMRKAVQLSRGLKHQGPLVAPVLKPGETAPPASGEPAQTPEEGVLQQAGSSGQAPSIRQQFNMPRQAVIPIPGDEAGSSQQLPPETAATSPSIQSSLSSPADSGQRSHREWTPDLGPLHAQPGVPRGLPIGLPAPEWTPVSGKKQREPQKHTGGPAAVGMQVETPAGRGLVTRRFYEPSTRRMMVEVNVNGRRYAFTDAELQSKPSQSPVSYEEQIAQTPPVPQHLPIHPPPPASSSIETPASAPLVQRQQTTISPRPAGVLPSSQPTVDSTAGAIRQQAREALVRNRIPVETFEKVVGNPVDKWTEAEARAIIGKINSLRPEHLEQLRQELQGVKTEKPQPAKYTLSDRVTTIKGNGVVFEVRKAGDGKWTYLVKVKKNFEWFAEDTLESVKKKTAGGFNVDPGKSLENAVIYEGGINPDLIGKEGLSGEWMRIPLSRRRRIARHDAKSTLGEIVERLRDHGYDVDGSNLLYLLADNKTAKKGVAPTEQSGREQEFDMLMAEYEAMRRERDELADRLAQQKSEDEHGTEELWDARMADEEELSRVEERSHYGRAENKKPVARKMINGEEYFLMPYPELGRGAVVWVKAKPGPAKRPSESMRAEEQRSLYDTGDFTLTSQKAESGKKGKLTVGQAKRQFEAEKARRTITQGTLLTTETSTPLFTQGAQPAGAKAETSPKEGAESTETVTAKNRQEISTEQKKRAEEFDQQLKDAPQREEDRITAYRGDSVHPDGIGDGSMGDLGKGIYFAEDQFVAEYFTEGSDKAHTRSFRIDLRHPFEMNSRTIGNDPSWQSMMATVPEGKPQDLLNRWVKGDLDIRNPYGFLARSFGKTPETFNDFLAEHGFDGIVDWGVRGLAQGSRQYVVFDKARIHPVSPEDRKQPDPGASTTDLQPIESFASEMTDARQRQHDQARGELQQRILQAPETRTRKREQLGLSKPKDARAQGPLFGKEDEEPSLFSEPTARYGTIGNLFRDLGLQEVTYGVTGYGQKINELVEIEARLKQEAMTGRMEIEEVNGLFESSLRKRGVTLEEYNAAILDNDTGKRRPEARPAKFKSVFEQNNEKVGENYREVFVTVPREELPRKPLMQWLQDERGIGQDEVHGISAEEVERLIEDYKIAFPQQPVWSDGHSAYSEVDNPVVRAIVWDITDRDGAKVLVVRELQPPNKSNQKRMPSNLRNKWREIGVHWAVNHALKNGYDRVVIASGQMVAGTYDLSKKIKKLYWYPPEEGRDNGTLIAVGKEGGDVLNQAMAEGDVAKYVGTEVAQRLLAAPIVSDASNYPIKKLDGLDLEIGGEGLKRLYDEDLPNILKKFGANLRSSELPVKKPSGYAPTSQETVEAAIKAVKSENLLGFDSVADALAAIREEPDWQNQWEVVDPANREALQRYHEERQPKDITANVTSIDVADFRDRLIDSELAMSVRETAAPQPTPIIKDIVASLEKVSVEPADTASGKAKSRSGVSLLGLGITPALRKGEWVDIRGRRIRGKEDLVAAGRLFRNPHFEIVHTIYVVRDEIVAHEAVSSRLPGTSAMFTKPDKTAIKEVKARIQRLAQRYGVHANGVSVFLLHNHPSGNVSVSSADVAVTDAFGKVIPQLSGHIVINHTRYSVIDKAGNKQEGLEMENRIPDYWDTPSIPHRGLDWNINSGDDLALWGKWNVHPSSANVTIAYLQKDNRVRAIESVPVKLFMRPKEFVDWVRGRSREYGAKAFSAYYANRKSVELSSQVRAQMQRYVNRDLMLDGVVEGIAEGFESGMRRWQPSGRMNLIGLNERQIQDGTVRVREADKSYDIDQGKSKGVSSAGQDVDLSFTLGELEDNEPPKRSRKEIIRDIEVRDGLSGIRGALAGSQRSGASLLGLAIAPEIQKGKWIDLRGKNIRGIEDVVAIGRLFRNPQFETFHAIYVRDGRIVAHEAVSTRLPSSSEISPEGGIRGLDRLRRRAVRTNADEVYFFHNHPSGDVKTSEADRAVTARVAKVLPQLAGHIIINHTTFSLIDREGNALEHLNLPNEVPDLIHQAAVPHEGLGRDITGPGEFAAWGKAYVQPSPENVTVIYRTKTVVRAIETVPIKLFMHPGEFTNWARGRAREYGGQNIFAYYDHAESRIARLNSLDVHRRMIEYTSDGLLLDGYTEGYANAREGATENWATKRYLGLTNEQTRKATIRMREPNQPYGVPKPMTQEETDTGVNRAIFDLERTYGHDKRTWKGVIGGLYDENVLGAHIPAINWIRSADLVLARNPQTAPIEKEIKYASRIKKQEMQQYNDIATGIVKAAGIKKGSEEDAMVKDLLDSAFTGLTPDELRRSAAYMGDKEAAIRAAERLRNEVFEPIIHRIRGDKELTDIIGQRGYIRGYFPHYWEQMKAKYGERDAALIAKHILPERFVSRSLKERESNAWLGNVSIFDVVPAYIQSTMRTIHDIPAYNRALQHLENVPDGSPIREFAGWYVDNYMGVNTRDYLGLIPRDHPIIKLSRWIAYRHYDATIGLNIKTWSVNTLQTLSNTVPELGTKYTAIGIRELATSEGRKKFHDAGLLFDYPGIESGILGERTYRRIMHGGMALAEYVNRGIAYLGGLEQAHDLGLVGKAAEHHAMDVVEKTQFTYSKESAIRTLDSLTPDMKVLMTFPMKEAEFFAGLVKDAYHGGSHEKMKLVRFLLINFGLAAAAKAAGLQIRDWLIDLMDMIPGIPRSLQLIEKLRTWLWRISDGQVKPKDIPKDILEGLYKAFGPGAVALRRLARQTGIIEDNRRKKAS